MEHYGTLWNIMDKKLPINLTRRENEAILKAKYEEMGLQYHVEDQIAYLHSPN